MNKLLLSTILLAISMQATEEYTYLSIGMLPDNVKLVCIDNVQWAQETTEDEIIISKLYRYNSRLEVDETIPCNKEQLQYQK